MQGSKTREKILKKIRAALIQPSDAPTEPSADPDLTPATDYEISFAQNYVSQGGRLIYCDNEIEFASQFIDFCSSKNYHSIICHHPALTLFLSQNEFPVNNGSEIGIDSVKLVVCEALLAQTGQLVVSNEACDKLYDGCLPVFVSATGRVISGFNNLLDDSKDVDKLPASLMAFTIPEDEPCYLFLISDNDKLIFG